MEASVITSEDLKPKPLSLQPEMPAQPAQPAQMYPNLYKQPLEQPYGPFKAPKFSVYTKFTFKTDFFRCIFSDLSTFVAIFGISDK